MCMSRRAYVCALFRSISKHLGSSICTCGLCSFFVISAALWTAQIAQYIQTIYTHHSYIHGRKCAMTRLGLVDSRSGLVWTFGDAFVLAYTYRAFS
jgi:hypothetical protein